MRTGRAVLMALVVLVAMTLPAHGAHLGPIGHAQPPQAVSPHSTLAQVDDRPTLRQMIGALTMSGLSGTYLTSSERDVIKRHHLGGVIMFGKNYADRDQMATLTKNVHAAVRKGGVQDIALISVDQEGGVVKRFGDMPPRYSHPQLGRMDDKDVTFEQGRATGRALRSVGVNVNLAPVADIDLPPNHVMRSRSFGSNHHLVARMTKAFALGLQRPNVAAALKHFPGLGGATRNSDFGPSYVHRSRWQLRNIDALPFKRAISNGVKMVMVGHAMYVNDGGKKPASLSRRMTIRLLRDKYGFKGVSISDAIESISWRFNGDVVKACKKTIQAGMDVALLTSGPDVAGQCAERIYKAVRNGIIPKSQIKRSFDRVVQLVEWIQGAKQPS